MKKLDIVYEDEEVLVLNKESNLLTIATEKEKNKTLYHYCREYLNRKNEKIFIVHRLDKDTSGIVIFAKSIRVKTILQKEFERREVLRKYECVVKEKLKEDYHKLVKQYLFFDKKSGLSVPTKDKRKGKEAITEFKFSSLTDEGSCLDITIFTGRQNQIRAALKTLSLTLLGDKKYAKDNSSFMHLNFYHLSFKTGVLKKKNTFEIKRKFIA